jgi:hypothetical protein
MTGRPLSSSPVAHPRAGGTQTRPMPRLWPVSLLGGPFGPRGSRLDLRCYLLVFSFRRGRSSVKLPNRKGMEEGGVASGHAFGHDSPRTNRHCFSA